MAGMPRGEVFSNVFMEIAHGIAKLSTCNRAEVGAVLVRDRQVLSMGYNGAPAGTPHCHDAGCHMQGGRCVRTVHAEQNAVIQAALHGVTTQGATLYCTHRPCLNCTKILINAGIKEIIFDKEYDSGPFAANLLDFAGVLATKMNAPSSSKAHFNASRMTEEELLAAIKKDDAMRADAYTVKMSPKQLIDAVRDDEQITATKRQQNHLIDKLQKDIDNQNYDFGLGRKPHD